MRLKSILGKIVGTAEMKPSACSCDVCREQCRRKVCFGTPEDILRLIKAGYAGFLDTMSILVVVNGEETPIHMIQLIDQGEEGCVMFKDGKCLLHDTGLKPTEGKLYIHPEDEQEELAMQLMSLDVAMEWNNPESMPTALICFIKVLLHRCRP